MEIRFEAAVNKVSVKGKCHEEKEKKAKNGSRPGVTVQVRSNESGLRSRRRYSINVPPDILGAYGGLPEKNSFSSSCSCRRKEADREASGLGRNVSAAAKTASSDSPNRTSQFVCSFPNRHSVYRVLSSIFQIPEEALCSIGFDGISQNESDRYSILTRNRFDG